jgi:hypothetical protein
MCLYDTIFKIGSETIKASLQEKKIAEEIFIEAKESGRAALLGQNLSDGLTEFKLGNIPSGTSCEVSIRVGFSCSNSSDLSQTFKFPLDCCTPSSQIRCLTIDLEGSFSFSL